MFYPISAGLERKKQEEANRPSNFAKNTEEENDYKEQKDRNWNRIMCTESDPFISRFLRHVFHHFCVILSK